MTHAGVLFVQDELQYRYEDEINKALKDAGYEPGFRFYVDHQGLGWNEEAEKMWPKESDIPILKDREGDELEQVGTFHVELKSVVKGGPMGEYVGREVEDYNIRIGD